MASGSSDDREDLPLALSSRQAERDFLTKVFHLILEEGVTKQLDGTCKVIDFKHPKDLMESFDFKIRAKPVGSEKLLQLCQETYDCSVKTAHPHYFNTSFNGQDTCGLAGAWISESLNTAQYNFEIAPVFLLMEHEIMNTMRELCGFQSGDGIFTPGGSMGNMFAINLARYRHDPALRERGLYSAQPLKIFVSDQAHYSILKGAMFMGIGTQNVVSVKSNARGQMIPEELEKCISSAKDQGHIPLLVVATSGTTAYGSFDPLTGLADVCERYDVWFHVDAASGGSALLSDTHGHLMAGIERANSVVWCMHKIMGVPYQCAVFLLNGKGLPDNLMTRCMGAQAQYIVLKDKFYDTSYDSGDKTIQSGRRVDIFKLWLMWKAKGTEGFAAEIDHKFAMTKYLAQLVKDTEGFELILESESIIACFWYIPPCLRGQERTEEYWKRLHKVAPQIKAAMTLKGSLLVTYHPHGSKVNFFKVGIGNARTSEENMRFVVEEIDRLGRDVQV